MSERFYVNCPLEPGAIMLDGPEAHHLAAVCRVRAGDAVCLFNGDGHEYPAIVEAVERKSVTVEIQSVQTPERELPFHLEIAVPLPKGDRAQFLIEKLTELGVSAVVPLKTARSVVHPREGKLEKIERWVIEASKQCGRNVLMKIAPLTDWKDYASRSDLPQAKLLAHPGAPGMLGVSRGESSKTALAVGPEGGFAPDEVLFAQNNGWEMVGLGARILRMETAAIVMAALAAAR